MIIEWILNFWQPDYIWLTIAMVGSSGYAIVLYWMIRKAKHYREKISEQRPAHSPLFYLGQTYLAFMWPLPLYLSFVAADRIFTSL